MMALVVVGSVLPPPFFLEECGYYRIPGVHCPFMLVLTPLGARCLARPWVFLYASMRGGFTAQFGILRHL